MVKKINYKRWLKWTSGLIGALIGVLMVVIAIAYYNQDTLVRESVARLNHDFKGKLEIGGSHISPFANFPYISIDLEDIKVYEGKDEESELLMQVADTYLGFDFWTIIGGTFDIKAVKLDSGFLKLVQHKDGSFNIANALNSVAEEEEISGDSESTFHMDLQAIELVDVDLLKLNEETNILVEAYIENAQSSLKSTSESTEIALDSRFLFNLIVDGDTSFLHDKHLELHTALDFQANTNVLTISPSELQIEKALFLMDGDIDIDDEMNLNLSFSGNKQNFDLFLAFAPPELIPVLERYSNGGRIYFDANVNGKSINGNAPQIEIDFGCEEAFVHNTEADKEVNELFFKGHFTNGALRDAKTMKLTIEDFSASPEAGTFQGNITVENFDSPDIDMQLNSQFDLNFLAGFLNLDNLKNVSGAIALQMNFHDIIDLENPERSIERLNESYYTELKVENLNFTSTGYDLPIKNVNIYGSMDGHKAQIERFNFNIGKSNIAMKASVSDLPAILHHSSIPVDVILDIESDLIDLTELTRVENDSSSFDEQIKDLSLRFKFNSSARAFTESPNLPIGEFFIQELKAKLTNYPHALHDFNADILIDTTNFRVIDFTGMIDESDFHFNGKLENYDLWFEEKPQGLTKIDFDLTSDLLQLDDLFSYGGENHVPEDYRHEEFRKLKLHGLASLNFDSSLSSTKIEIDHLSAKMKVHPMRFENFSGTFYIDSVKYEIEDLGGQLGNSNFKANLVYYHQPDNEKQHQFKLSSSRLDFDQLFAYNPPPASTIGTKVDHESGFNIFEVPFANMKFNLSIDHLNYHRMLLDDFVLDGRMQADHFVYIDSMAFNAAGGEMNLKGYFNGSNPEAIYFSPNVQARNIDLDQLLFKFENFGQDHLVSENLHGKLTGTLSGKIHMHADMVPIIDDSELHIDVNVVNGSLENYSAFEAMSDYFADKNLAQVRFDTLSNKLDFVDGTLSIPSMNINSSLGYFEVSGEQGVDLNMEYYVRIPVKVVTRAAFSKLFSKKDQDTSDQVDEIEYRDETKRTRFVNVKITGTPDNYDISLGKDK